VSYSADSPDGTLWQNHATGELVLSDRRLRQALGRAVAAPPFDPVVAEDVLSVIAEGVDPMRLPSGSIPWRVIRSWLARYPDFAAAFNEACEAAADRLSWDTLAIADTLDEHPVSRGVRIKARQDMAKVLNRRKYDPNTVVAVANAGANLQRMSTAALLDELAKSGRPVIEAGGGGGPPETQGAGEDPYGRDPSPENTPLANIFEPV
jgi:hypothetical protein